jgi:surfactin synthase thioesterase subunit
MLACLHVFDDGHLFMLTRPQETARVIGEFLAQQLPAR